MYVYTYRHTDIQTYIHTYIPHSITLRYIALHCIAFHYTTIRYITLHYIIYIQSFIYHLHPFKATFQGGTPYQHLETCSLHFGHTLPPENDGDDRRFSGNCSRGNETWMKSLLDFSHLAMAGRASKTPRFGRASLFVRSRWTMAFFLAFWSFLSLESLQLLCSMVTLKLPKRSWNLFIYPLVN